MSVFNTVTNGLIYTQSMQNRRQNIKIKQTKQNKTKTKTNKTKQTNKQTKTHNLVNFIIPHLNS